MVNAGAYIYSTGVTPLRGRQMHVGRVKVGDFRQITAYISKTVQDRRMVTYY